MIFLDKSDFSFIHDSNRFLGLGHAWHISSAGDSHAFGSTRIKLEEIEECVASGQSLAFETTLSGKIYLRKIAIWQKLG